MWILRMVFYIFFLISCCTNGDLLIHRLRGPPSPLGNVKGSSRTSSHFSEYRFSLIPS